MAVRKIPFVTSHFYHIFNRSLFGQPIFEVKADYLRFTWLVYLLQFKNKHFSPSAFFRATNSTKEQMLKLLENLPKMVNVVAYCIMPNHYHFILEQLLDNGIQMYISNLQNAYTRFFNIKHETKGQVFEPQFKGVLIENDPQFLHTTRYVLLNPYTSYIVRELERLPGYVWSSLPEYLGQGSVIGVPITYTRSYSALFKDRDDLWQYLCDQADYQRELARIKHLLLE